MLTGIAAVLFDYGNTIIEFDQPQIDSILERLAGAWAHHLEPVELSVLQDHMRHVAGRPHAGDPPTYREHTPHEQMELLVRSVHGDTVELSPQLVAELDRILQDAFVDSICIDDADLRALRALHERFALGLVSNYPCGDAIRRSLERIGIDSLFAPIVVSGEVGRVKPHALPFEVALEALSVPAEKILFVGDRWDADMVGASRVGMKTCHLLGHTRDRDLAARYSNYLPDFRVARLNELVELLAES